MASEELRIGGIVSLNPVDAAAWGKDRRRREDAGVPTHEPLTEEEEEQEDQSEPAPSEHIDVRA